MKDTSYSGGADLKPCRKLLLFGPQAQSFDIDFFNDFRAQLGNSTCKSWALDALGTLPGVWDALAGQVPKLRHLENGRQLLQELSDRVRQQTGGVSLPFPLPNMLLSPLVVIAHLVQWTALLVRAAEEGEERGQPLPPSITEGAEVLGLCTGILSGLAAACSSSAAELERSGAVAVRLAMLVGALVDAEQLSPDSAGAAASISVSGNTSKLEEILSRFPEVWCTAFPLPCHHFRAKLPGHRLTQTWWAKGIYLRLRRREEVDGDVYQGIHCCACPTSQVCWAFHC